jgi:hypothetical protein
VCGGAAAEAPNPYADPGCQETHALYARIFSFFPRFAPWCRQALATYADCIST